ncbi:hypothetical protein H9650_04395 [Psychrobacillus sp. Sa2BUA9]|uniref:Transposase n=1 Tax=Psychrobacillus faecigallinarum TaxID=2762235 RepID=A0ABR8R6D3_9BACI|nr:hypothetical protein [Psychrobacillus faecigallinarum]MBD7943351.1 hypothetical protein [Psychrobacillus faecigallinarum]
MSTEREAMIRSLKQQVTQRYENEVLRVLFLTFIGSQKWSTYPNWWNS